MSSAEATLNCYIAGGARLLTITPSGTTRVYGGTDDLGYTVSGLLDGDAAGDVLSGSLGRAPGDDAGSYAINLGTLAIAPDYATKYRLPASLSATTYVITPKLATYTVHGGQQDLRWHDDGPRGSGGQFRRRGHHQRRHGNGQRRDLRLGGRRVRASPSPGYLRAERTRETTP